MTDALTEPWPTLGHWWAEAEEHPAIRYAHAAVLSTVDLEADPPAPDARVVLVHEHGPEGFVISTDDASAKAGQLRRCPRAALVSYWEPIEKQVRIRGRVEATDDATADRCFAERPRASRITVWASRQGPGLVDRDRLDRAWEDAALRFDGIDEVPRPAHWRAWRLVPESIELWRAGAKRLHDRWLWTRVPGGWAFEHCWP